jgi:tetratricopeptide (TPR) repeat protein
MKSKERHELKTNELAEWFVNLPVWFEKNRNTVIAVSTGVILLAVLWFWHNYQKNVIEPRKYERFTETISQLPNQKVRLLQAKMQQMEINSNLRQFAANLSDVAETTANPVTAAFAYIEQGKFLRTDLHYQTKTPDKNVAAEQLNKAKEAYGKALAKLMAGGTEKGKPVNESLAAQAIFGIGLCEEELGNFDAARQKYLEITGNSIYQYTTGFAEAQRRLDIMADFQQEVVFNSEPAPVTGPAAGGLPEAGQGAGSELPYGPLMQAAADKNSPNSILK